MTSSAPNRKSVRRFGTATLQWSGLGLMLALGANGVAGPARGQAPYIVDEETIGRTGDNSTLRFCVDPRDLGSKADEAIGNAIASALLIEPKAFVVLDTEVRSDFDRLYRHLREDCDVYFGFKLIPGAYPDWLAVSRPYSEVGYRFVVENPGWNSLADVPKTEAIGPTIGTSADFRLIQYLQSLGPEQRWRRFPMATDEMALQLLLNGTIAAALVWEPSYNALRSANPAYAELRTISSDPLPPSNLGVGAAMLAKNSFLRSNVDEAIAALIADGTIQSILAGHGVAATVPR